MASENLSLIKEEYIKEEKNLHNKAIQDVNTEKTKKMNNLFCENCSLQFDKKIVFDLHLSLVHGEKIGVKNEDKKESLVEFVPGKILASKKTLTRHKSKFHDVENITEAVQNFAKLNNHNEKPFQCKICDAKFTRNSKLTDHIAEVHEKSIKCDICKSHFQSHKTLTVHIKHVHEGKKSHECSICNTKHPSKGVLQNHVRAVHEGIKPFSCTICKATFKGKQGLKQHVEIIHEGKKKFGCPLCDIRFSQKGDANRHMQAIHEGKT